MSLFEQKANVNVHSNRGPFKHMHSFGLSS